MIFVIVGPTGVGKSSLALEYAEKHDAYIVNGDAFQCYKEMNIGTAKPSLEERSTLPHYLFDIATVDIPYTIFEYQRDLRNTLDTLLKSGKDIIIVGGSGLYLKSALYDFTLNEQKVSIDMSKYDSFTNEELYEELKRYDEPASKDIHPNNRKRVLRAIEIYLESGKRKSDIIAEQEHKLLYDVRFVGLSRESRDELYSLIDKRVLKMFEDGLLDEVKLLIEKHDSSLRAFQAIGYKEIIEGLKNNETLDNIISLIQKNTRNYAKRQYTYFRNQLPVNWFNSKQEAYNFMEENGG